jgi:hypothetical protein
VLDESPEMFALFVKWLFRDEGFAFEKGMVLNLSKLMLDNVEVYFTIADKYEIPSLKQDVRVSWQ